MKIGTKVIIVLIPPVLVLLVLAALIVSERLEDVSDTRRSEQLAVFVTETGELVHELQLERMWTSLFMASDGEIGRDQVDTQRGFVGSEIGIFREGAGVLDRGSFPAFDQRLIDAETALAQLDDLRTRIDQQIVDDAEAFDRYGDVISELLSTTAVVAQESSSPDASLRLVELADLARAKDSVSRVAAAGSELIQNGLDGPEGEAMGSRLAELDLDQRRDLARFAENANPASTALVEELLVGDEEIRWSGALESLLETSRSADRARTLDTSIPEWTDLSTERLEGLREVQKELAQEIIDKAADARGAAVARTWLYALFTLLGVSLALYLAWVVARATIGPLRWLTDAANTMATERLPALVERMRSADVAPLVPAEPVPDRFRTRDEIGQLAEALNSIDRATTDVAEEQGALLRRGIGDIFVNLARRNRDLLDRQINFIDQLEAQEGDPDRLNSLFKLDHLATQMRRNAESLLVLAGQEQATVASRPVPLGEVIRVAVGEVEDFSRLRLVGLDEVTIDAAVGVDLAHLLSELMENATRFAPDTAPVDVAGHLGSDGSYLITVIDQGAGMSPEDLAHANGLLANPPLLGLAMSKSLGFIVVARLAARWGVEVELTNSLAGGMTAGVTLPVGMVALTEGFADDLADTAPGASGSVSSLDIVGTRDDDDRGEPIEMAPADGEPEWTVGYDPGEAEPIGWSTEDDVEPPGPALLRSVSDAPSEGTEQKRSGDLGLSDDDYGREAKHLGLAPSFDDGEHRADAEPLSELDLDLDLDGNFAAAGELTNGVAELDAPSAAKPAASVKDESPTSDRPSRSLPSPEWVPPGARGEESAAPADSFWAGVEDKASGSPGGADATTTVFAGTPRDRAKSSFDQALAQILGGDDASDVGIDIETDPIELPQRVRAATPTDTLDFDRLGWEANDGRTFTESDAEVVAEPGQPGDIPRRPAAASLVAGVLRGRTEPRPLAGVASGSPPADKKLPPANHRVASSRRSPSQVRSMLSAYRSGIDRGRDGRRARAENDT